MALPGGTISLLDCREFVRHSLYMWRYGPADGSMDMGNRCLTQLCYNTPLSLNSLKNRTWMSNLSITGFHGVGSYTYDYDYYSGSHLYAVHWTRNGGSSSHPASGQFTYFTYSYSYGPSFDETDYHGSYIAAGPTIVYTDTVDVSFYDNGSMYYYDTGNLFTYSWSTYQQGVSLFNMDVVLQ